MDYSNMGKIEKFIIHLIVFLICFVIVSIFIQWHFINDTLATVEVKTNSKAAFPAIYYKAFPLLSPENLALLKIKIELLQENDPIVQDFARNIIYYKKCLECHYCNDVSLKYNHIYKHMFDICDYLFKWNFEYKKFGYCSIKHYNFSDMSENQYCIVHYGILFKEVLSLLLYVNKAVI